MTNLVNTPFKMLERMNADLNDQTAMTSSVDQESARLYSCADVDIIFLFFCQSDIQLSRECTHEFIGLKSFVC